MFFYILLEALPCSPCREEHYQQHVKLRDCGMAHPTVVCEPVARLLNELSRGIIFSPAVECKRTSPFESDASMKS